MEWDSEKKKKNLVTFKRNLVLINLKRLKTPCKVNSERKIDRTRENRLYPIKFCKMIYLVNSYTEDFIAVYEAFRWVRTNEPYSFTYQSWYLIKTLVCIITSSDPGLTETRLIRFCKGNSLPWWFCQAESFSSYPTYLDWRCIVLCGHVQFWTCLFTPLDDPRVENVDNWNPFNKLNELKIHEYMCFINITIG